MKRPYFFYLLPAILLFNCQQKSKTLFRLVPADDSGIEFRNDLFESDQLNILNVDYFYNGGGVAIGDFDNDGLSDVFLTGNMVTNKLYLNQGELKFKDVSEEAGILGSYKWKSGVALVDINNDGWLDIYVCATISPDSVLRTNMLFVNQGLSEDGKLKFVDKAAEYGIADSGYSSNAAFFDYDNDGDLDLYILTNTREFRSTVAYRPKINDGSSINTDKLYRNNGDGTFTDVTKQSGILCEGHGLGLAISDFNNDGLQDVYVGNDYLTNDLLYMNKGKGMFSNEIDAAIKHQSRFSMGNDVSDINNDGNLDIITLDMLPETNQRKKTVMGGAGYITYINDRYFGYTHQYVRNMLQLNNGNNTYSEIGQLAGVYQTEWSWAPLFADFDNDGYKDLIITNGFPRDITDHDFISYREKVQGMVSVNDLLSKVPSVKVPNYAFKNQGNLTFSDVTKAWGFNQPTFSNGAAFADLDNDGDLDYIVNNINEVAYLYENTLYAGKDKEKEQAHYLRIKLHGAPGNLSGLGAKVTLRYGKGKMQFQEHAIYRGYVSTVEDAVHFGLGNAAIVDTLLVEWPDGRIQLLNNVKTDQVLKIDYTSAELPDQRSGETKNPDNELLFREMSKETGIQFKQEEEDKIDFNIQRTLPHKFSQGGPGIASGDVNGDKRDDFFVGGSADHAGTFFMQQPDGSFKPRLFINKTAEDMGVLLFDADNDNDLDLYCVSGSYEFEAGSRNYQDRIYVNDGKGNFTLKEKAMPVINAAGSCVRAADFDGDGDLDLFVGGRVIPGKYPFADRSYLLQNDKGVFSDVTSQYCSELTNPGMISDAFWSDVDNDGKTDLLVVGEFMPVTIFKNLGNSFQKLSSTGIENYKGWFNSIVGGDFDNDGDIDYVAGNLGLNNYYNVSVSQPLTLCAKDFDNNGSVDAILSCYSKSEDGTMKSFPAHFWDDLNSQSPKFRKKFESYRQFANETTDQFFSPDDLKDALKLDANYMATAYIQNNGGGKFSIKALPVAVQVAPVNGMIAEDVDRDGNLDLLMVGNDYSNEPTAGQYDAFTGLYLRGDGHGNFQVVPSVKSGFLVNGDAKGLAKINAGEQVLYIATQNNDSLKVFSTPQIKPIQRSVVLNPLDSWAELVYEDGKKVRVEFYYGCGYLSQSARIFSVPAGLRSVTVHDFTGKERDVATEVIP